MVFSARFTSQRLIRTKGLGKSLRNSTKIRIVTLLIEEFREYICEAVGTFQSTLYRHLENCSGVGHQGTGQRAVEISKLQRNVKRLAVLVVGCRFGLMKDAVKIVNEQWCGIIDAVVLNLTNDTAERLSNPARIANICACEFRNEIQAYPCSVLIF